MKTSNAIELFGSVRALADALGITVHAIYQWGDEVPKLREYEIKEILESKAAAA
jgi:hypothetical protein